MSSTKELNKENQHWHQDHLRWIADIEQWQHETHRLVALLYKLEKTLPEHSSKLEEHLNLINHHERQIERYRANLELRSQTGTTDMMSATEQDKFHRTLAELHIKTMQQHDELKKNYSEEMEKFRQIAKELLQMPMES